MSEPNNFIDRDGNPIECRSGKEKVISECLKCHNKIVRHCDDCAIQMTGCRCTIVERFKREVGRN